MPSLKNARHELMAQYLAQGKSADDSYTLAGFKQNRHNAANLGRQEHILTRVSELLGAKATKNEVTVERMAQRLGHISIARLTQFVHVRKGKVVIDDTDGLPEEIVDAIAGLRSTKDGVEVKFHDPLMAINLLGKHRGMFKENINLSVEVSLSDLVNASYSKAEDKPKDKG